MLTTTDGGSTYKSHASKAGYTTSKTGVPAGNPNQSGCLDTYDNGLTGSSGSYDAGTENVDRLAGDNPDPVFLEDSYDITDLAGAARGALRFSYATDPGLALPGWFIDDLEVVAKVDGADKVLYSTDFESTGKPSDPEIFNGGCKEDLSVATSCTKGWSYLQAGADSPQDHAYYLEMRDRSGFDFDGKGEIDRAAIGFQAGLSLVYTDEAHGYGNAGTDDPPAQSPLDAVPTPGSSSPNLNDASFKPATGRASFSDSATKPHVDNYKDPNSKSGNWTFDYSCLDFDVTAMSGDDAAPVSNLTGDVTFKLGTGCGDFNYGYVPEVAPVNTAPKASATATPNPAKTGQSVSFSGLDSTDKETPNQLDYSWDFGDNTAKTAGPKVSHAFLKAGTYDVKLKVTDLQGLQDTVTIPVTVTGETVENTPPTAKAKATPSNARVNQKVELSAQGSTDAETPDSLTYVWDFDNGGTTNDATTRDVTTSYAEAGEYNAKVTVKDGQGLSSVATVKVTVTATGTTVDTTDPTAVAKVNPRKVFVDRPVSLDGSDSSDDTSASNDLTYSWSQGDGGNAVDATGKTATVTYAKPGVYTVELTVADEAGNTSTDTKRVRVLRYVPCSNDAVDRVGWKIKRGASSPRGGFCKTTGKRKAPHEVTYTFKGQALQILIGKASKGGFAKVIIDGKSKKQLNFRTKNAGQPITFKRLRTYGKLGGGTHTVELVMKKTKPRAKHHGYVAGFVVRR